MYSIVRSLPPLHVLGKKVKMIDSVINVCEFFLPKSFVYFSIDNDNNYLSST